MDPSSADVAGAKDFAGGHWLPAPTNTYSALTNRKKNFTFVKIHAYTYFLLHIIIQHSIMKIVETDRRIDG